MIRRLLAATALVLGLGIAAAPSAVAAVPTNVNAAGGDVLCVWNIWPLNQGLCIGV